MYFRITLIALICNDTTLQRFLPQILLTRQHQIPQKYLRGAEHAKPPRVFVWTKESHWVNAQVFREILSAIWLSLKDVLGDRQIILLLDCAPCHIHWRTANHAAKLGIWLVYIPAKMTYLLQPLDRYIFAGLKQHLKELLLRARALQIRGAVSPQTWLEELYKTIDRCLCRRTDFATYFEKVGAAAAQLRMSMFLRERVMNSEVVAVGAGKPDADDIALLGPSTKPLPWTQLARPLEASLASRQVRPPSSHVALPPPGECQPSMRTPRGYPLPGRPLKGGGVDAPKKG